MIPLRAMRSGASRLSVARSASRGYATVASDVAPPSSSLYDQKVDMSQVEKGKGFYINYKRIADNLEIVRSR